MAEVVDTGLGAVFFGVDEWLPDHPARWDLLRDGVVADDQGVVDEAATRYVASQSLSNQDKLPGERLDAWNRAPQVLLEPDAPDGLCLTFPGVAVPHGDVQLWGACRRHGRADIDRTQLMRRVRDARLSGKTSRMVVDPTS